MKENKYDEERFFEKYSQMDRSRKGLQGAGEWPALEKMLPPFAGRDVLDLGCGYGWHCRYAAEHGAASVLGTDLSQKMLAVARTRNAHPQVTYRQAAMEDLDRWTSEDQAVSLEESEKRGQESSGVARI